MLTECSSVVNLVMCLMVCTPLKQASDRRICSFRWSQLHYRHQAPPNDNQHPWFSVPKVDDLYHPMVLLGICTRSATHNGDVVQGNVNLHS